MGKYEVKFYEHQSYKQRQIDANRDGAICFVAHHLNGINDTSVNYCCCIVGTNASQESIQWATDYCGLLKFRHSIDFTKYQGRGTGVVVGGYEGRGNSQLIHTNMPAILPEPIFATNPQAANQFLHDPGGIDDLAEVLVTSIQNAFPEGGLVAFSIGHGRWRKNRRTGRSYMDYGTWVADAPQHPTESRVLHEWDYCKNILEAAAFMLNQQVDPIPAPRPFVATDLKVTLDGVVIDIDRIEGLISDADGET
jgi:hypothetical protein